MGCMVSPGGFAARTTALYGTHLIFPIRTCRRQAFRQQQQQYRYHSSYDSFSAADNPIGGFERPTPVVFLSGETLSSSAWKSSAKYFSQRGYSGLTIELPHSIATVDAVADRIAAIIRTEGLTPPILVAHSLSTFIAQKYLESYSLSGLILVNPVAPNPVTAADRLLRHQGIARRSERDQLSTSTSRKAIETITAAVAEGDELGNKVVVDAAAGEVVKQQQAVTTEVLSEVSLFQDVIDEEYYNGKTVPKELLDTMINDPTAALELEPGVVPMLVVCTTADFQSGHLTENDLDELLSLHSLDRTSVVKIDAQTRAPMCSVLETENNLNETVFKWVESL